MLLVGRWSKNIGDPSKSHQGVCGFKKFILVDVQITSQNLQRHRRRSTISLPRALPSFSKGLRTKNRRTVNRKHRIKKSI